MGKIQKENSDLQLLLQEMANSNLQKPTVTNRPRKQISICVLIQTLLTKKEN